MTRWGTRREPADPTMALGRGRRGRRVRLELRDAGGSEPRHGLLLGATGSGKTTSLLRLLDGHVAAGAGALLIDLKGSEAVADQLSRVAAAHGVPALRFSLDGGAHWDPLAHGSASELADKLFATQRFSEPHYAAMYRRYLQAVMRCLLALPGDRTLAGAVALLAPDRLLAAVRTLSSGGARETLEPYVAELTADQRRHLSGLADRLAVLLEAGPGRFLVPAAGRPALDLHAALSEGAVVWAGLDVARYPDLALLVGALLVGDVRAYCGAVEARRRPRRPVVVAIDEFAALGADAVGGLFAMARSAGVSALLASQELADLRRVAPWFADQVLGNLSWLLAGRQNVPASAELLARVASDRAGGVLAPAELATLGPGEAVLIEMHPPRALALRVTPL